MMGLIVVFPALGGTTGSLIIGQVFGAFSGQTALYLLLVPMALMIVSVYFFKRAIDVVRAEPVQRPSRATQHPSFFLVLDILNPATLPLDVRLSGRPWEGRWRS